MRACLKTLVAAGLTALTLGFAAAPTPASAGPWPHPWRHHHHFWGPGFGLGMGLGFVGGVVAAEASSCYVYRPMYDAYGNYLGQRAVNLCE